MKVLSAKKEARLEKKKKKIAALAELVKLNDQDNMIAEKKDIGDGVSVEDSSAEPQHKKRKLDDDEVDTQSEVTADSEDIDLEKVKLNLSEEQYTQIKKELNARKRALKNVPNLRLREFGERASLQVDHERRTPIFLTDIQHLLMTALIGNSSPCTPERWCYVEKPLRLSHSLVVVVEGMSLYHFISNESKFVETNKIFDTKLEVIMPTSRKSNIIEDLATVPLTNAQKIELTKKYGSLEVAIEMNKDPTLMVNTIFKIEEEEKKDEDEKESEDEKPGKVPRTKLLLSALQMVDEGYPLPLRGELAMKFKDYVLTQDSYKPVHEKSPMFGVDCEMCRTSTGLNELTRISIVDEKLQTVYESLVRPTNRIVDYLTRYSGITEEMMLTVTKTLPTVQEEVRALLPPDAILIGQSLNADLHAMKMMHPYCIDTSVIFNITGHRKRKSKLQTLAKIYLDEIIQTNVEGHDSVEDSLASMKLVQLKLEKGLDFGDVILDGKKRANQLAEQQLNERIANNLFAHVSRTDRKTSIVTTLPINDEVKKLIAISNEANDSAKSPESSVIHCLEVENNKEAVKKAQEIALENALTIANLSVDSEKLQLSKIDKTISKIDKYVAKLYESVAKYGMFVVIFGGVADSPSGVVNIKIKKKVVASTDEAATDTN